jgi:glycine/D-amino acid oxidase-like deaminating enzyme
MQVSTEALPLPPSLWAATAQPAIATPALRGAAHVDVAIVGGGYTGLSTALHLAEEGARVCVLEASEPGWGASGRNGGQVIPGLKYDPDDLVKKFGAERADPLIATIAQAADNVFDLIARHGIDCQATRQGWIQPAHSPKMLEALARRARQWEKRGAPVSMLDRRAIVERVGTQAFLGGWIDRRAGSIQPLSYVRGLVRAALRLGVAIHGNTLVTKLERDGARWCLSSAHGTVTADRVVIATNGYTGGLWPRLQETVIAANSFIVATRPLPPHLADTILPGGEVGSDSRRLLLYFRKDAEQRFVLGGRGPFAEPRSPDDWRHLERSVALLFPQLKGVEYEYRWAGRVAITRDFMPHVHEPAPGVTIALGYNGRGIAMATTMGQCLAQRLAHPGAAPFPFPISAIQPIPLHGLQRFYIAAGVAWYRLLDRMS